MTSEQFAAELRRQLYGAGVDPRAVSWLPRLEIAVDLPLDRYTIVWYFWSGSM